MWYQIPDTLIHSTPSPYTDTGVTSPITIPNILVTSKMHLVSVRTILVSRSGSKRAVPSDSGADTLPTALPMPMMIILNSKEVQLLLPEYSFINHHS